MTRIQSEDNLEPWLGDELRAAFGRATVAGAALGVYAGGRFFEATAGCADLETGAPVERDTCFQIGSITKVFVSALVLRLAQEGKIDLNAPLTTPLPHLKSAMWEASVITPRHLLSHTSGIEGEMLPEAFEGDLTVDAYLDHLVEVPPFFAPGAFFSYCNNGFMVAAQLIETVTGMPWHEAMRQYILAPLGLNDILLVREDKITRKKARGHSIAPDQPGGLVRHADEFALPPCCGPMGSAPTLSTADVLRFAAMVFLGEGPEVLSAASRAAIVTPVVTLPEAAAPSVRQWGLGASIDDWNGARIYGHDGDTTTFLSYLRVDPQSGTAAVLLTNGGRANDLAQDVFSSVFGRLAGTAPPIVEPVKESEPVENADRFSGTYCTQAGAAKVSAREGQLFVEAEAYNGPIHRESENIFQVHREGQRTPMRLEFGAFDDDGIAQTLFSGVRLLRRAVADPTPSQD